MAKDSPLWPKEAHTVPSRWLIGVDDATRHNLKCDLVNSICVGAFVALTLNFIPVVARRMDADPLLISVILAAPFAGSVLNLFSGYWLPRRNRLRWGTVVIGLARGTLLLTPLVLAPLPFAILAVIAYLLIGLPNPVWMEVLREMYPPEKRASLISITRVGLTGAITIGSLIGGGVLDALGPQVLFPLGALLGVSAAVAYSKVKVNEVEVPPFSTGAAFGVLREDRVFAMYTVAMVMWGLGNFMFGPYAPLVLVDRLHASYTEVGLLSFVTSLSWLLSYLYWGRNVDRLGAGKVMAASQILTALVPLLYWLSPSVWLLMPAAAAAGIASGGIDLAGINAILHLAPPERIPHYTSVINAVLGFRGMVAPFIGTALAALPWFGVSGVFVLSAALILGGAMVMSTVAIAPVIARGLRTPPTAAS